MLTRSTLKLLLRSSQEHSIAATRLLVVSRTHTTLSVKEDAGLIRPTTLSLPESQSSPTISFNNVERAFIGKTTAELIRAYMVFQFSASNWFVQNARSLLYLSEHLVGRSATHYLLKKTFFGHFCAGESAEKIAPVIARLRAAGVGAILDFAAEADLGAMHSAKPAADALFDAHVKTFLSSIETASLQEQGIVAIKVTALAETELLERFNAVVAKTSATYLLDVLPALSENDRQAVNALFKRLQTVAESAHTKRVRLLIDAEQTYFQQAIDLLTLELQRSYNRNFPTVFGTYQCYLRSAFDHVQTDLERAKKEGFIFAAKIVRGAYLFQERKLAQERGYADPIHPTLADTHKCYDNAIYSIILSQQPREVMIASQNENSIRLAVDLVRSTAVPPKQSGVLFGQLLGMSDHITFNLGYHGFSAYKYVPYGPVGEVIPYLLRRAEENSSLMAGASVERQMIRQELFRRTSTSLNHYLEQH